MDGRRFGPRVRMERFLNGGIWKRIDSSPGPDACWPWLGRRHRQGYGVFSVQGKMRFGHRRILELTLGRSLEPDENALHTCDNPPCCNPAHLYAGSRAENMADMVRRGRAGRATLTVAQVLAIRVQLASGQRQDEIADEYGVAQSTISMLHNRYTWRAI